uniref:AlNc14C9G1154 protein n=1 Tax=Albugo laibachii Nc14 TaxID=890382 RepID=F0W2A4_9STRA|nr:AlNc14C9G1154 [Albugo laibachii Nc14]|eukprot:CCA15189.1 AlNc14C9G1154 [Albugo laibachii Nc14]
MTPIVFLQQLLMKNECKVEILYGTLYQVKQYFILINAERPYSVLQVLHSALEAHARGSSSSQFTFTVIPGDQPEESTLHTGIGRSKFNNSICQYHVHHILKTLVSLMVKSLTQQEEDQDKDFWECQWLQPYVLR